MLQGSSGTLQGKPVVFAGANEDVFTETTEMSLMDGFYPMTKSEALLNKSAIEQLGLSIGDTVTATVPNGAQKDYTIVGVCEDLGTLLQADVYGMILSEEGFRVIADENAKDGSTYRIQFKDGVDIQKAIIEIKATFGLIDNQVSENTTILPMLVNISEDVLWIHHLFNLIPVNMFYLDNITGIFSINFFGLTLQPYELILTFSIMVSIALLPLAYINFKNHNCI